MLINYQSRALRGLRYLHLFLRGVVLLLVMASLAGNLLLTFFLVDGHSMDPTLHDRQVLPVDLLSYRFRSPRSDEVVILSYAGDRDVRFVKRILGTPGQTVEVGGVTTQLGEDEYFVAGDNREHSTDSRTYGPVRRSQIVGRVLHP